MNNRMINSKISPLLHRGEYVRWTGSSSRWAYFGEHVPFLAFGLTFTTMTCWAPVLHILRHDFEHLTLYSAILLVISAWMITRSFNAISKDVDVHWAITDRRIFRLTEHDVKGIDIRTAITMETNPRKEGQGDLIVYLANMNPSEEKPSPNIHMLNINDLQGACQSVMEAIERPLRAA